METLRAPQVSPSPLHGPLWQSQAHSAVISGVLGSAWVSSHGCLDALLQKQTLVSLASHPRDHRPHSLVSSVLKTSCFAFSVLLWTEGKSGPLSLHPSTSWV